MAVILGLSPGSCHVGLAVFKNGRLLISQTKTFGGKWTNKKFTKLMHAIGEYIRHHKVTDLAIKVPDDHTVNTRLVRLLEGLNVLCEREEVTPHCYTLKQIRRAYTKTWEPSKEAMIGSVILKYPQLQAEYYKSQTIKTKYYERLFEAVLVGHTAATML